jgi:hypothetical protein
MSSRRLLSWMLALALLFGQAAAFAHAFEHLKGGDADKGHPVCEVCVSQAGLGGVLPATGFALSADPAPTCPPPPVATPRAGVRQPFARARAPPLSV